MSDENDTRSNVVIRIPERDLSRLQAWMAAGHVVAELHITGLASPQSTATSKRHGPMSSRRLVCVPPGERQQQP